VHALPQAGFPTIEQLGLFKLEAWGAPLWIYQASALKLEPYHSLICLVVSWSLWPVVSVLIHCHSEQALLRASAWQAAASRHAVSCSSAGDASAGQAAAAGLP